MQMRQQPSREQQARRPPPMGDADAFEAMYATNHRRVLAYCARRASRSDAWDAAAETFAIAWRRIDDVPSGERALPWLLAVAYRVISNQRRSQRRRNRLNDRVASLPVDAGALPDAQLVRSEEESNVIAALERLRDVDREILMLALWEELPRQDIAIVLGISRDAVDQRVSRAKRRLAAEVQQEQPTGRATPEPRAEGGAT